MVEGHPKVSQRSITVMVVALLVMSCENVRPINGEQITLDDIQVKDYSILEVETNALPYNSAVILTPLLPSDSCDADGILMFYYAGQKYYHPVNIAQRTLLYLNTFRMTGDSIFIYQSKKIMDKLLELGVYERNTVYFPYTLDIYPHNGLGINNTDKLGVPWFSGMAQGQILSALVRLYNVTQDVKYLNAADLVFNSFIELKRGGNPWTVYVDDDNYYWIEEYPLDEPSNVLNGFIMAVYGLYDYYWLDPADQTRSHLLKASLYTLEKNVLRYRRPGQPSLYCLKHQHVDNNYHRYHIDLINKLYLMTGEMFFKGVSALFAEDA